jgi:hypothetical protein
MRRVTHILSSVLSRGSLKSSFVRDDLDFFLQRGRAIHIATALLDAGTLDWKTVDERIVPYVRAWEKFRREVGGKIIESECHIENKRLNYEGTLDRIISKCALYPIGNLLIDIKTNEADAITRLQTMAYATAQKRAVKRGFVALRDNGTYSAGIYDADASDKAAWLSCLKLYNWIERNTK